MAPVEFSPPSLHRGLSGCFNKGIAMQSVSRLIDRDIPEGDERILRTYCGETIQNHVRLAYWHYKLVRDKGGLGGCQAHELAMVVTMARLIVDEAPHDNPLQPFDIAAACAVGAIPEQSPLRIWWRKKECKAEFMGHNDANKTTKVLLLDDISERDLPDDRILGVWPEQALQEA